MVALSDYLKLTRPLNLLIVALLQGMMYYGVLLPVLEVNGIDSVFKGGLFPVFILVTVIIAASGNVINDIIDIGIDKINKPSKWIAGNTIPLRSVGYFYIALIITGWILSIYIAFKIDKFNYLFLYALAVMFLFFYFKKLKKVFLFGNYNLYEQNTLAADLTPDWVLGVGVNMPLTTRDGRSGKLQAAKTALIQLDYLTAQAIQDLQLLVEKTWREANTAMEEYQGLASSLALAHENINLREKAFAQGLSTSLEVIDAELFLVSVKTQRQAAAYQYVLSLAQLLALSNQMAVFSEYQ